MLEEHFKASLEPTVENQRGISYRDSAGERGVLAVATRALEKHSPTSETEKTASMSKIDQPDTTHTPQISTALQEFLAEEAKVVIVRKVEEKGVLVVKSLGRIMLKRHSSDIDITMHASHQTNTRQTDELVQKRCSIAANRSPRLTEELLRCFIPSPVLSHIGAVHSGWQM